MSSLSNPANRPKGLSRQSIRLIGLLLLAAGIVGQSILQNAILHVATSSQAELQKAMEEPTTMAISAVALVLEFVQGCAVPIFCFLLVEGFTYTTSGRNYFLRVLGLAVVSEVPYNFAMTGKLIDLSSRNPVFGLVVCLAVLFLYRQYEGKSVKNIAIKVLVFIIALMWMEMLQISDGGACVVVVTCLYGLRYRRQYQILLGCASMFLASAFSTYYLLAPITFLFLHFYNDEDGEGNKIVNYAAYPVLLLIIGLIGKFAF